MPINTQPNSGRFGQTYKVQPAPGGVYHVYPDGTKQFIKAGAPQPMADPNAGLAAAFAHAAQNTGTGPFSGNAAQWQAAAAATGTGPAAPAAAPAGSPDPRDATYWGINAGRTKSRDDQLAANTEQGTSSKAAYDEALRRLRADRPGDTANVNTGANKQGLFYSSTKGNRLDDLATSYARRESDATTAYNTSEQARIAARKAIEDGYTVEDAADVAAAADRQVPRDAAAADAGALAPPPAAPKIAAPKPYRTVTSGGVVYHVYPDGRRVALRRVA